MGNMCIKFADDSKLEELTDLESEMISTVGNAGSKASRWNSTPINRMSRTQFPNAVAQGQYEGDLAPLQLT